MMPTAIEEMLRWATPVRNMNRTATCDAEVHGQQVREGDRILLLYPSGNRDESVFEDPDTFRIDRSPNPHIAFGFGSHFCMGANLARMEIKVVFEELFRRLPDIAATDPTGPVDRSASAFVAGIHRLPARFTPVGS